MKTEDFERFKRWWKSQWNNSPDLATLQHYYEWIRLDKPDARPLPGQGILWDNQPSCINFIGSDEHCEGKCNGKR